MVIPKDIRDALEADGVEFDEFGNPIEKDDWFASLTNLEEDDSQDDDQDTDDQDDQDDDDEDRVDDDQDDDQDDDEDDEDEDDEPEPKRVVKKTQKKTKPEPEEDDDEDAPSGLTLTPKVKKAVEEEPKRNNSSDVLDKQQEILNRLNEISNRNRQSDQGDENEEDELAAIRKTLEDEVAHYKRLRLQDFANSVEDSVNRLSLGATFKDIIQSEEWNQYLSTKIMGAKIGDLYLEAIRSSSKDDVISIFNDFAARYVPSVSKHKNVTVKPKKKDVEDTKDKLEDLVVPDRTKSNKQPPKKSRYDFVDTDYQDMLDKAERGRITVEEFAAFEDKFTKAERTGRVKKT